MTNGQRLHVYLAQDGATPQAFRWQGRTLRVQYVELLGLRSGERRFRLHTAEGAYEAAVAVRTAAWTLRRAPGWWERLRADIRRTPRYPLPAWQRRSRGARPRPLGSPAPGAQAEGSPRARNGGWGEASRALLG